MQDRYARYWGIHYFGYGYEWPREIWVETPENTNREHHDRTAVLGTIEGSSSFACSLSGHPFVDLIGSLSRGCNEIINPRRVDAK